MALTEEEELELLTLERDRAIADGWKPATDVPKPSFTGSDLSQATPEQRREMAQYKAKTGAVVDKTQEPSGLTKMAMGLGRGLDAVTGGMPNTTRALAEQPKERPIPSLKDAPGLALSMFGDVAGAPTRALAGLRKDPETGKRYTMDNPDAAILRPEMEKLKTALGVNPKDPNYRPPENALQELGGKAARFGVELAGGMASDPVTYFGWLANAASGPMKRTAVGMEQRAIGPRPSQMKKGKIDFKNVFEYGVGGSPRGTQDKISALFDKTEDAIQNVLNQADEGVARNRAIAGPLNEIGGQIDQNAGKIDMGAIFNRVRDKVVGGGENLPDEALFGTGDQGEKALAFWADELTKYKKGGLLSPSDANKAKRLIGKKAWKKGPPTPDTQAKETVADLLYLELMGEIEKAVPEVRGLNKVFRDLIPISDEIDYRIGPIENRQPVDLGTAALAAAGGGLFSPGGLGMAAANMTMKNPTAANVLYGLGKAAPGAGKAALGLSGIRGVTMGLKPEDEELTQRRPTISLTGR